MFSFISRSCLGRAFKWDHLALLLKNRQRKGKESWYVTIFKIEKLRVLVTAEALPGTFCSSFQRTSFFPFFASLLSAFMIIPIFFCVFCYFYFLRLSTWSVHFQFILLIIASKVAYISLKIELLLSVALM